MNTLEHSSPIYLRQRRFPFGVRELTIDGYKTLTIDEHSLFRKDQTKIPLEVLQSSPASSRSFSVKWLFNSIFLISLTLGVFWFSNHQGIPALQLLTVMTGIFSLYAVYQFFAQTTNLVIYRNSYTNENYLYLWNNNPNRKRFKEFIEILNQRIECFEYEKASSPAEKIELFSQHLAFLHSEKIISDEDLSKFSKKVYRKALEE